MTVGERILELLAEKGITQKELSVRTGIPQSTISDWKGKKINPGSEKVMIICEVLGVDPAYLLSGTDSPRYTPTDSISVPRDSEDYTLLAEYRNLSSDNRKRLLGYLQALKELQMSDN